VVGCCGGGKRCGSDKDGKGRGRRTEDVLDSKPGLNLSLRGKETCIYESYSLIFTGLAFISFGNNLIVVVPF
jgi:hypothetical protein